MLESVAQRTGEQEAARTRAQEAARTRAPEAYLVTTAPENPRDELAARQRRYLWTMGLRVVFFILAIVLYEALPGARAVRFIAAIIAMVLPWIAVVAANAGPRRRPGTPAIYQPEQRRAIPGPQNRNQSQ